MNPQFQPPLGSFNYVVQPGDTLYEIARRFNTTMNVISRFNLIPNQDIIYIGQTLVIPYSPPEAVLYKVSLGDTLYSIAKSYGTTINNIVLFNYLPNPNLIYPGQILIVPASLR